MRTALLRPAALVVTLCSCSAASRGGAAPPTPSTSANPVAGGERREPGSSFAEERRYVERARALRDRIISQTTWADLNQGPCPSGFLRTFAPDSGRDRNDSVVREIEMLERIIIARGVDSSLNSPAAHDLFRTVMGWEVAGIQPKWDVKPGEKPRTAIAAGLTGQFKHPETGKCESYVAFDSATVILPDGVSLASPRYKGVVVKVLVGEAGLRKGRDEFYAMAGHDVKSIFTYVRIRAAVVWKDFAVVAVNRPAEQRGIVELPKGAGGAAYIFHRVGREWRLLTITRSWG